MRITFLDRDDTIIKDYPDTEWKNQKQPEFLENSVAALKLILQKGYKIIIITNQYLIDEGFISLEDYLEFDAKFQKTLKANQIEILATYFCPNSREENSYNLKPNPGMIKQALKDYQDIDLTESFVVGDSLADIGLAQNMNLPIYSINQISNYSKATTVASLYEAANLAK